MLEFVARPRTDDGRRVPLSTRVSDKTFARLEKARGSMSVSAALNAAVSMWLDAKEGSAPAPAPRSRPTPVAAEAPQESVTATACKHPKGDVIKGRCRRCQAFVGF
jgi:hypothetical protein